MCERLFWPTLVFITFPKDRSTCCRNVFLVGKMETSEKVIRLLPCLRQTSHPSACLGLLACPGGTTRPDRAASQHTAPSPGPRRLPPSRSAAVLLAVPSLCNGGTDVVFVTSCGPQRQAVSDDFESPPIEHVDPCQVQVTDKKKCWSSLSPWFSAHLCRRLLQWEPSPAQDPHHTAHCSMKAT